MQYEGRTDNFKLDVEKLKTLINCDLCYNHNVVSTKKPCLTCSLNPHTNYELQYALKIGEDEPDGVLEKDIEEYDKHVKHNNYDEWKNTHQQAQERILTTIKQRLAIT